MAMLESPRRRSALPAMSIFVVWLLIGQHIGAVWDGALILAMVAANLWFWWPRPVQQSDGQEAADGNDAG